MGSGDGSGDEIGGIEGVALEEGVASSGIVISFDSVSLGRLLS